MIRENYTGLKEAFGEGFSLSPRRQCELLFRGIWHQTTETGAASSPGAVWPWASNVTSLGFSFVICDLRVVMALYFIITGMPMVLPYSLVVLPYRMRHHYECG